jgi:hypothetical protein
MVSVLPRRGCRCRKLLVDIALLHSLTGSQSLYRGPSYRSCETSTMAELIKPVLSSTNTVFQASGVDEV